MQESDNMLVIKSNDIKKLLSIQELIINNINLDNIEITLKSTSIDQDSLSTIELSMVQKEILLRLPPSGSTSGRAMRSVFHEIFTKEYPKKDSKWEDRADFRREWYNLERAHLIERVRKGAMGWRRTLRGESMVHQF